MKKIILALLISFTALSADYVIKEDGTLTLQTTQSTTTPPPVDTWVGAALPTKAFNVLDYGLKGDGVTDDSAALEELAKDTDVTNWYFPSGYTFKLHEVSIPSHIVAVYGAGTIRAYDNGNNDSGVSKLGAFILNGSGKPCHDNLILDGLHFEMESGYTTAQNYGMVTVDRSGGNNTGVELRNCTFDGANGALNGIKVFTDDSNIYTDLKIYNNESYNNSGFFDIELIHLGTPMYDGLPNLKIYNNYIHTDAGSHGGISIPRYDGGVNSTMEIYNNRVHDKGMAIEVISRNIKVHHNEILNCDGQAFSIGEYTSEFGDTDPTAETLFYSNHIEMTNTGYIYSYSGSNAKIYDNFIKGRVILRLQIEGSDLSIPDFYENTVVTNYPQNSVEMTSDITGLVQSGSFHDNIIYNIGEWDGAVVSNTESTFNSNYNTFYMSNTRTCMVTSGTDVGNVCNYNYVDPFPAGRPGAGLL